MLKDVPLSASAPCFFTLFCGGDSAGLARHVDRETWQCVPRFGGTLCRLRRGYASAPCAGIPSHRPAGAPPPLRLVPCLFQPASLFPLPPPRAALSSRAEPESACQGRALPLECPRSQ